MSLFLHCSNNDLATGLSGDTRWLRQLPASLDGVFEAQLGRAFKFAPTDTIRRSFEDLEQDPPDRTRRQRDGSTLVHTKIKVEAPTPRISVEEFEKRYGDLGLETDEPIPEGLAELWVERKQEEIFWQAFIDRAASPFEARATGLVAGATAAVVDPVNFLVNFVSLPVNAAAKFMFLGLWAGRFTAGAIEGLFTSAVIEEVVLAQAQREGADHDRLDSLEAVGRSMLFSGVTGLGRSDLVPSSLGSGASDGMATGNASVSARMRDGSVQTGPNTRSPVIGSETAVSSFKKSLRNLSQRDLITLFEGYSEAMAKGRIPQNKLILRLMEAIDDARAESPSLHRTGSGAGNSSLRR